MGQCRGGAWAWDRQRGDWACKGRLKWGGNDSFQMRGVLCNLKGEHNRGKVGAACEGDPIQVLASSIGMVPPKPHNPNSQQHSLTTLILSITPCYCSPAPTHPTWCTNCQHTHCQHMHACSLVRTEA